MDNQNNNSPMETAEELEAEKQSLAEVKEEEIRQHFVTEYGFSPETDKERLDKLVARELEGRKKLSSAIGTKIKYRTELENARKAPPPRTDAQPPKKDDANDLDAKVTAGVQAELDKRDLENMPYPDDLKAAIKRVAEINGISIKKAESDPYIASKVSDWKKTQEADEAAITRKNNSGGGAADGLGDMPQFDLSTADGRKKYDDYMAKAIKEEEKSRAA